MPSLITQEQVAAASGTMSRIASELASAGHVDASAFVLGMSQIAMTLVRDRDELAAELEKLRAPKPRERKRKVR